jgi:NAD(P)-dependent dehydrogenase (short-subunit alcohol dehydrogenase family)
MVSDTSAGGNMKANNRRAAALKSKVASRSNVARIAKRHEELHREQLRRDRGRKQSAKTAKPRPAPTIDRDYPGTPLPRDTISKPGKESKVSPAPAFLAPDYKGSGKLSGKIAIVSGGDSGIGRAVAVLFAREGADVAIAYLSEHEDAEETKRWVEEEGQQAILLSGDARDKAFCEDVVKKTLAAFGKVDILVNNAAFQLHAHDIEENSEERLDETFRTNIYGLFFMANATIPHMPAGSAIINTGSVVGLQGSPELLDYSATKGAIHAFTKSLARNVLKRGIRVNAVAPGPVWTPLNPADKDAKSISKFGEDTDMHRAAQPEELSPAYVFLAAPCCSSYISGIVLPVTGSIG